MKYTAEEEQFLIDNAPMHSAEELVSMMNERFGTNRSIVQIRSKCRSRELGVKIKNNGRYGVKEKEQLPIGTVRAATNGTYIKVKEVPNGTRFTGYARPYWIPVQENAYIDAYGEVPSGKFICFLNCDRNDLRPDNLYPITRRTSIEMSRNNWWSENREITLTAIKWCELYVVSHESKKPYRKKKSSC